MRPSLFLLCLFGLAWLLSGCASEPSGPSSDALASITTADLHQHIETLASDAYGGRAPASEGESRTVTYLISQFQSLGLSPGNGNSYVQSLPLVSIEAQPTARLRVDGAGGPVAFDYGHDLVAWTQRPDRVVALDEAEMIFAGYGIVAPEYDWNDYAGVDVQGKTVVLLVHDPGFATGDSTLFDGRAMTYYGRWTYKIEEAARQGAEGVLLIHDREAAGYDWEVVTASWSGPQFGLLFDDRSTVHASVEGWLHRSTAETLLNRTGRSYAAVVREAAQRTFSPFALEQRASLVLRNRVYRSSSRNVIARLPGRDRPDEHVVFTAHWDHLGQDLARTGDTVFNGAVDNATGVAGLIEIAAAFASMEKQPSRSILFLAPGAEEHGLLGSRYYTDYPTFPLNQTAAVFNLDGMNVWGPTRDVTVVGAGQSDLETVLARAAMEQDRTLRPEPAPEKGRYFRSDHFSFAREGVPSVYVAPGIEATGHGPAWARERHQTYLREHYHRPSDEYDPDWDLRGMADDLRLLLRAGHRVAHMRDFPRWNDGSAFKPQRSLPGGSP